MKIPLPVDPSIARVARRAVLEQCGNSRIDLEAALLCTSELATNALLYGAPPLALEILVAGGRLRVGVCDGDARPVAPRPPAAPDATSGRGLGLVDHLADRWGVEPVEGGKVVWFEIPLEESRGSR